MGSTPQILNDWPPAKIEAFRVLYGQWSAQYPEIYKTGPARVALLYRLFDEAIVQPLHEQLAVVNLQLAQRETTTTATQPSPAICPRCGGQMRIVEYDHARRGRQRELRCINRHTHHRTVKEPV